MVSRDGFGKDPLGVGEKTREVYMWKADAKAEAKHVKSQLGGRRIR